MDPVSLLISWQCFLSPSPMADSFAGVSSPGCWTLLQVLEAFQMSTDELALILMGVPSFVTCGVCCCSPSLAAFSTLSLFCLFGVLTMICYRECFFLIGRFFWFYLVFCLLLVSVNVFPWFMEVFFCGLVKTWYIPLTWDSSPLICAYTSKNWFF